MFDKYKNIIILVLILLVGAGLRIWRLGKESLWYDELYAVWSSRFPLTEILVEQASAMHPPVYFYLGHFWFSLFTGDAGVRSFSVIWGMATIVVVFLIGSLMFNNRAALWASALASISPFLIWYSREATYYSWVAFISMLSFYCLLRGIKLGGRPNWIFYYASTTIAVFSHFFTPVLLLAQLITFFLLRRQWYLRGWSLVGGLALAAQSALLVGMSMNYTRRAADAGSLMEASTFSIFISKFFNGIMASPVVLIGGPLRANVYARHILLFLSLSFVLVLLFIASRKVREVIWEKNFMALSISVLLLVTGPVFLFALLPYGAGVFRFYSWATPLFLIILGRLIAASPRKLGLLLGFAAIFLITVYGTLPAVKKPNWDIRSMMTVVSQNQKYNDRLLCFPVHHCVVAESQYPNDVVTLGGLNDQKNRFFLLDRGQAWSGYQNFYGDLSEDNWISGEDLRPVISSLLLDAERVWILAGDGTSDSYHIADGLYQGLNSDWYEVDKWIKSPYRLSLYERR